MFLSGCSTTRVVATPPQLITPPAILLEDCNRTPVSSTGFKKTSDIVKAYSTLHFDFQECNNTKKALREWVAKMKLDTDKKD